MTFAGVHPEDVEFFLERVTPPTGEALDRWKDLQLQGWDVTALVDAEATTMVGLGCRYAVAELEQATA
jgi:hypothetical protein